MLLWATFDQNSVIVRVKILDSTATTGAGKTGLTSASAGLIVSTIADSEAAPTVYTQGGSTIETITTLGTYAAPTATKCRFKEVDATNHPGVYEMQFADARFSIAGAKSLLISILGATGAAQCDAVIPLPAVDLFNANSAGLANLSGDAYARLGAPAGASVSADIAAIEAQTDDIGAAGAGLTAADDAILAILGSPAGASLSADVAAVKVDTAAILVDTGTTLDLRIPAALVGGRMDASIGAVAAGAIAAASFAVNALDAVWSAATRILTAGTNIVLAKGVGVTGFNDLSAAQVNTEADTALADVGVTSVVTGRIDAAVSTRASQASLDTTAGYVDTEIGALITAANAIKAVTDLLPNGGALTALANLDAAISSRLATAGYAVPPTVAQVAEQVLKHDWTTVTGEPDRCLLNANRGLRNKVTRDIVTGTVTVMKEDDTTPAWTATTTTDAAAEPIVGVDPA